MLKIAVIGVGHLGKIHVKCIKQIPEYELVGIYDIQTAQAQKVSEEFGIKLFLSMEELIAAVDVVDIVTPTVSHFEVASKCIREGKHVFIEKPVTNTLQEAKKLLDLATEARVKSQIGHVERFNPAYLAVKDQINNPMFIEAHRLAMFNPRGLDVPVVLDLMIHDIDLILSVVNSKVRKVNASGTAIISDTPDIANARLEFCNGCVANITASRISLRNMRKSRFFQQNAYISVDFLEKKSEIVQMKDVDPNLNDPFAMILDIGNGKEKHITIDKPESPNINSIQMELACFHDSIVNNTTPLVPMFDGYYALEVAYKIMDEIEKK